MVLRLVIGKEVSNMRSADDASDTREARKPICSLMAINIRIRGDMKQILRTLIHDLKQQQQLIEASISLGSIPNELPSVTLKRMLKNYGRAQQALSLSRSSYELNVLRCELRWSSRQWISVMKKLKAL